MTFPSSPFPRTEFDGSPCSVDSSEHGPTLVRDREFKLIGYAACERCDSHSCVLPYYRWEHERGYDLNADRHVHSPPRNFPLLRSSPLWQQTWVEDRTPNGGRIVGVAGHWQTGGRWFPPLTCGPNAFGDRRKKIYTPDFRLQRLYTVDNCAECVTALQAVELMVYGCARTAAEDAWADEHRCWFGHRTSRDMLMWKVCTCGATDSVLDMQHWEVETDRALGAWMPTNARAWLFANARPSAPFDGAKLRLTLA